MTMEIKLKFPIQISKTVKYTNLKVHPGYSMSRKYDQPALGLK